MAQLFLASVCVHISNIYIHTQSRVRGKAMRSRGMNQACDVQRIDQPNSQPISTPPMHTVTLDIRRCLFRYKKANYHGWVITN